MSWNTFKIGHKSGLPPGSAVHVGERRMESPRITVFSWNAEGIMEKEMESVEELFKHLMEFEKTWINVDGLHDVDVMQRIGEHFRLHPLVVEDIMNTHLRPKLEVFEEHLFLSMKMHMEDTERRSIGTEQVSLVLGKDYVLTFQERTGDVFDPVRERLRKGKGRIRSRESDYLAYALMDAVVDHLFVVLETFGERLEDLEEELIEDPTKKTLHRIHTFRRQMILLRRSVWPLREVVSALEREETPLIRTTTRPYLRDLYDHSIQAMDSLESYREMVATMLETYLSSLSNRMNEVMKVLTLFAAIFIPLTFIAGIYGMNFNAEKSPWNMPELNWFYGYPFALGLMALVGISLLVFFRVKKWI